jgi:hypothetical protein
MVTLPLYEPNQIYSHSGLLPLTPSILPGVAVAFSPVLTRAPPSVEPAPSAALFLLSEPSQRIQAAVRLTGPNCRRNQRRPPWASLAHQTASIVPLNTYLQPSHLEASLVAK